MGEQELEPTFEEKSFIWEREIDELLERLFATEYLYLRYLKAAADGAAVDYERVVKLRKDGVVKLSDQDIRNARRIYVTRVKIYNKELERIGRRCEDEEELIIRKLENKWFPESHEDEIWYGPIDHGGEDTSWDLGDPGPDTDDGGSTDPV